jgi:hypothetical protein
MCSGVFQSSQSVNREVAERLLASGAPPAIVYPQANDGEKKDESFEDYSRNCAAFICKSGFDGSIPSAKLHAYCVKRRRQHSSKP